ncbi:MAG: glutathione-disulfide reductase [Alphaproteobacteria bacterium]|jgi:glutathione reductase (NADPH)|tara:strand:- start:133 stop:1458 length:1326 start_codon:yes stop_codon:yes gene_type:complete
MIYDLIVIGAGSGGVRSARIASSHGAKVAIVEGNKFGGTCVNVGCVPKKLFFYVSQFNKDMENYSSYGWDVGTSKLNWKKFIKKKDNEINRLNGIYRNILTKNKITIIEGYASFLDKNTIKVGKKIIKAKKFIIATGSKPRIAEEFKNYIHSSDDIFQLHQLPKKMTILGGGYIAIEFACIFSNLGVEIDIIYRGDRILKDFDKDITERLQEIMKKSKIKIHLNSHIKDIKKIDKNNYEINLNKKKIKTNYILSAIGRIPNVQNLDLSKAKIQINDDGSIKANRVFQTTNENIYALGDVINYINLTPMAIRQGHYISEKLFNKKNLQYDFKNVPTAVFSSPQLATVGLTLEAAKLNRIDCYELKTEFKSMKKSFRKENKDTFYKLVIEKNTKKVIGAHILSDDAGELIQLLGVLVVSGATIDDFRKTVAVHPTSSEELITI